MSWHTSARAARNPFSLLFRAPLRPLRKRLRKRRAAERITKHSGTKPRGRPRCRTSLISMATRVAFCRDYLLLFEGLTGLTLATLQKPGNRAEPTPTNEQQLKLPANPESQPRIFLSYRGPRASSMDHELGNALHRYKDIDLLKDLNS